MPWHTNSSVQCNISIMPTLLAAHGLNGFATVATCFGIGKSSVLMVVKSGRYSLSTVGNTTAALNNVYQQAFQFVFACYGQPTCESMSTASSQYLVQQNILKLLWTTKAQEACPQQMKPYLDNVCRAHYGQHGHMESRVFLN